MTLELSDDQVLDISKLLYNEFKTDQKQKLLDDDHLDTFKRKFIKPLFPHKYVNDQGDRKIQKYSCTQICCQIHPGSFCCCSSSQPDKVYTEFGLGMNLYFKFMKHFCCFFFFIAFLSLISMACCYWVAIQNDINPISDYHTFFFAGTMGVLSAEHLQCKYSAQDSGNQYAFTLSCPKGTVNYFGPVFTANSQNSLKNCRQERTKFQTSNGEYFISTSLYTQSVTCNSQNSQCGVVLTFSSTQNSLIAFPYECVNPVYSIYSFQLQKKIVIYIIVGIDFLISIFLLFFLCSQHSAEDEEQDYFKQRQLALNDFSIKVKGFTPKDFDRQFQVFIKGVNKKIEPNFQENIIQIKIPDNPKYIKQQQERRQYYGKLFQFMQREFFDNMIDPNVYNQCKDFISSNFSQMQDYLSFKSEMKNLLQQYRKSKKKIQMFDDNEISIYLVMLNAQEKIKLYRARQKRCCSQDALVLGQLQFSLSEAPAPDLLQWDNKQKWTCCRIIFSWIFTLIICFGSYVLFGYIQFKKNDLLSQYNFDVDCSLFYSNVQLATWNAALFSTDGVQYTNCYCSEQYFSLNLSSSTSQYCSSWIRSYVSYLVIPILISAGIVLYNLIVSHIFKKLTEFQGFYLITDELFSYTIKRAFLLILNMGLIMILLNLNYNGSLNLDQVSFLFTGTYSDMTADWYLQIATIIIMTLLFNIFFPFLQLLMLSTLKCFRKCFDKRCWTRKTSTKYKKDYLDLYSADVYPIQERYAILIAICWITMAFNCVIPFLNVVAALSLMIMQLSDRVLIFKVFKKPINYDQSLHKKVLKTIYLSYIVHTVATVFLISEPNLIAPNSTFSDTQSLTTSNQRLNIIIQTYYTLPYVVLFILLVVYGLLKSTIISCFSACLAKCNKTLNKVNRYKIRQDFFESLNQYQLNRLKLLTEKQMIRVQNLSRNKHFLLNANSRAIPEDINITETELFSASGDNSQMRILKRTHTKLKQCLKIFQANEQAHRAKLIGMPGYQILCNDDVFNSQKKILLLDSVLQQIILLNSPRRTNPANSRATQ